MTINIRMVITNTFDKVLHSCDMEWLENLPFTELITTLLLILPRDDMTIDSVNQLVTNCQAKAKETAWNETFTQTRVPNKLIIYFFFMPTARYTVPDYTLPLGVNHFDPKTYEQFLKIYALGN